MAYTIVLTQMPWSKDQPRAAVVPLPLLVLGARLRQLRDEGLDIDYRLMDLDLVLKTGGLEDGPGFFARAADLLDAERADAYFFSTHGPNESIVVQVAQELRARNPDCLIAVGGVMATLHGSDYIEHFPEIDVVIRGEGEPVLRPLLEAALAGGDFSKVPSAAFRHAGGVVETERAHVAEDGGFLFPDYSLVDLAEYARQNTETPYLFPGLTPIEPGRGCSWACRFCSPAKMWNGRVRSRAIPDLVEEMAFVARHGLTFAFLTQDTVEESYLRELSQHLIETGAGVRWGCYARPGTLSQETAALMARAGCCHVFVGFEAADPELRSFLGKAVDREAGIGEAARFGALGIRLICSFVAGIPGATREQFANTLEFALECSVGMPWRKLREEVSGVPPTQLPWDPLHYCIVNPLACIPGTDFHDEHEKELRFARVSTNDDSYGSHIFGANDFVREHWRVVSNGFTTVLSDREVDFYYPIIRVFNLAVLRPHHLAWVVARRGDSVLELLCDWVGRLGRERIMRSPPSGFRRGAQAVFAELLGASQGSRDVSGAARAETDKEVTGSPSGGRVEAKRVGGVEGSKQVSASSVEPGS